MICVIVESPYHSPDPQVLHENIQYARQAMQDCLRHGEAPFLSHLLYTQVPEYGFVAEDQHICVGRELAIQAGLAWGARADKTVVYIDRGISQGMEYGIKRAQQEGRAIEYRGFDTMVD